MKQGWVKYVNYGSDFDGEHVTATYSYSAGRWIIPGELVYVCDEFGYWRDNPPVVFAGRTQGGFYRARHADGSYKLITGHVIRDVIPC